MGDEDVVERIRELVRTEHELRAAAVGHAGRAELRARLREVELALDECWDLLRHRRARAEHGDDAAWELLRDEPP